MADVKRVLVVDDDKAVAEAVQYLFEDEGYEVVTSTEVADALEKSATEEFSVAVLDAAMDGHDLCVVADCLRSGKATAHIPIVILSGLKEAEVRSRFDRYDLFVYKDADLADFVARVEALTRRA